MSLFDELFHDIMGESRPKSPEVAPKSPAENGSTTSVIAQSPLSPSFCDEKAAQTVEEPRHRHAGAGLVSGEAPCTTCGCGSLWRDQSGDWHCEQCAPPGGEHVTTWRNISRGRAPTTPRPAMGWPADLNDALRRVATAFEWSQQDVNDFRQWARRSAEGMADAVEFLRHEMAKLAVPGLGDGHRRHLANDESDRSADG